MAMHYKRYFLAIIIGLFCNLTSANITLESYFTSHTDLRKKLIELITQEQKSIKIAIYYLSDPSIIKALVEAKKKNIELEIIIDKHCLTKSNIKNLQRIINADIPIYLYETLTLEKITPLMHNKYCIFECNHDNCPWLWSGSFNFTYTAQRYNQENALLTNDNKTIEHFRFNFEFLKQKVKALKELPEFTIVTKVKKKFAKEIIIKVIRKVKIFIK